MLARGFERIAIGGNSCTGANVDMTASSSSAPDAEAIPRLLDACLLQRLNAEKVESLSISQLTCKWEQLLTQLLSQFGTRPGLAGAPQSSLPLETPD